MTYYGINYDSSIQHHGIKGMKWGVRRYQNPDGTLTKAGMKRYYGYSKHQLKKEIKKAGDTNYQKVMKDYTTALYANKKWNELGKRANKTAKEINRIEDSGEELDNSTRYRKLWKELDETSSRMDRIEYDVGKKFLAKLDEARLKDIKYSESLEKGREMLEKYNLNYRIRNDGYIEGAYIPIDYTKIHNM